MHPGMGFRRPEWGCRVDGTFSRVQLRARDWVSPPAGESLCQLDWSYAFSSAPALACLPEDRTDGGVECRFYIQIARIQQEGVDGRPHGRGFPPGVTFVATADIRQHGLIGCGFAPALHLQMAAPGAHFRGGGNVDLDVGLRTNGGADIA